MKPHALLVLLALALPACRAQDAAPLGRLAFVRGDSLYVQALPDGKARLLASGRPFARPRWSPTGRWIAAQAPDGLRLFRTDADGRQQLTKLPVDFAWAPTDDRIAYVAEGNLVVARAGGIGVVLVAKTRDLAAEGVAWSPDGQRLTYLLRQPLPDSGADSTKARPSAPASSPAAPPAPRPDGGPRLGAWSIPARGGTPTPLARATAGDERLPPDGAAASWAGPGRMLYRAGRPEGPAVVVARDTTGAASAWLAAPGHPPRQVLPRLAPPADGRGWGEVLDYRAGAVAQRR